MANSPHHRLLDSKESSDALPTVSNVVLDISAFPPTTVNNTTWHIGKAATNPPRPISDDHQFIDLLQVEQSELQRFLNLVEAEINRRSRIRIGAHIASWILGILSGAIYLVDNSNERAKNWFITFAGFEGINFLFDMAINPLLKWRNPNRSNFHPAVSFFSTEEEIELMNLARKHYPEMLSKPVRVIEEIQQNVKKKLDQNALDDHRKLVNQIREWIPAAPVVRLIRQYSLLKMAPQEQKSKRASASAPLRNDSLQRR